jgi:hypothetical protein
LAKPNYRQQKKQKEQARLTRQAEKLKRRTVKLDESGPEAPEAAAASDTVPPLMPDKT